MSFNGRFCFNCILNVERFSCSHSPSNNGSELEIFVTRWSNTSQRFERKISSTNEATKHRTASSRSIFCSRIPSTFINDWREFFTTAICQRLIKCTSRFPRRSPSWRRKSPSQQSFLQLQRYWTEWRRRRYQSTCHQFVVVRWPERVLCEPT